MSQLLREEDIRQYFLQNNGVVRNTDIVNYFRSYLSNPAIREESRVLFKAYVNKLAAVKVENGEKFLVLKRQYFHPIDGNGNVRQSQGYTQPTAPGVQGGYSNTMGSGAGHDIGLPFPNGLPNPGVLPPSQLQHNQYYQQQNQQLGSNGAMINRQFSGQLPLQTSYEAESAQRGVQMHPPLQRSLSQVSQNYLGSQNMNQLYRQDSASSARNYGDMYGSGTVLPMQRPGYPMGSDNQLYNPGQLGPSTYSQQSLTKDFPIGLPPPSLSRQSSSSSGFSQPGFGMVSAGGSGSRLPPPYRPPPYRAPPPAARFPAYPTETVPVLRYPMAPQMQHNLQRMDFKPMNQPPLSQVPGPSINYATTPTETKYLQQQQEPSAAQLDSSVPAPPVPPRTKRASFKSLSRPNLLRMESSASDPNDNYMNDKESATFEINGNGVSEPSSRRTSDARSEKSSSGGELDNEKENIAHEDQMNGLSDSFSSGASEGTLTRSQAEQLLSVKERTKKFNRMASESEIVPDAPISKPQQKQEQQQSSSSKRRETTNGHHKQDTQDYDTASLSSFGYHYGHMQPKEKEWILKASDCDYHSLLKLAQENPVLIKRKDINGYTALHWAAKRGNADLVKLLAGSYKADVNAKSNGGYTALHLAAQFSRQEVYDLLVQVYNADTSVRDHSGKKPMQYLVRQDTSVSMDTFNTFKKLKDKRRSAEQRDRDSNSFLRIGSLNVRVKKTTEAFGYLLGKSNSTANVERILHKSWGSADNLPEDGTPEKDGDKNVMPPPSGVNVPRTMSHKHHSKKKQRRGPQAEAVPIQEVQSDSDSDCGFGSGWKAT